MGANSTLTLALKRSAILVLLRPCGPSAISGFIVTIGIRKAIKREVFPWATSHISHKAGEILPTLANDNAAAPIKRELFSLWICAALPHASPGPIFCLACIAVNKVVSSFSFACRRVCEELCHYEASTTPRSSTIWLTKIITHDNFAYTAIA